MKKFALLLTTLLLGFCCSSPAQNYPVGQNIDEVAFQQRKTALIDQIADNYGNGGGLRPPGYEGCSSLSDFGKYNYPKIIAIFDKYGTAITNAETDSANTRLTRYQDCPTFHFNLVGLPRIIYNHSTAPALTDSTVKHYLDEVFDRTDSYNAWTSEGTENHNSMSRTSGYLYAQIALEKFPTLYPNAQSRLDSMKYWIEQSSKKIYAVGSDEWNSSTYGIYNVVGWINLYDFATDAAVKDMARAVVDYYAAEIALHYTQGLTGGAEMRGGNAYESLRTGTDYLGWLWYGDSPQTINSSIFSGNDYVTAVHAATSSYRPPSYFEALAKKDINAVLLDTTIGYNSKPLYAHTDSGAVKQSIYLQEDYTLGAAYLPYGGWSAGDWQIISWKLAAKTDSAATASAQFMSGGGMYFERRGLHRKPFDQLVHHKNVVIQMSKVPTNSQTIENNIQALFNTWQSDWQTDFDLRFPTDTDRGNPVNFQNADVSNNDSYITIRDEGMVNFSTQNNVLFVELDKVYVAIRSINGTAPVQDGTQSGFFRIKDTAPRGVLSGFVIEVGQKSDPQYSSMANFQSIQANNTLSKTQVAQGIVSYSSVEAGSIVATYQESGTFEEPVYDWGYGPTKLNSFVYYTSPPFETPAWPSGAGHGKIASWRVGGQLVDLSTKNDVYNSPLLKVSGSMLKMYNPNGSGDYYYADYTGDTPTFGWSAITGLHKLEKSSKGKTFQMIVSPNPAHQTARLQYTLPEAGAVQIIVTDLQGRSLYVQDVRQLAGEQTATLPLQKLSTGVYIISVSSRQVRQSVKLVVE